MRQFKQYKKDTIGNGYENSSHILRDYFDEAVCIILTYEL